MLRRSLGIVMLVIVIVGCNKAKFSGPSGDQNGANAPLDLSDTVDKNNPSNKHNTGKYDDNNNTYTEPRTDGNGNPINQPNPNIKYDPNTKTWNPTNPTPGGFDTTKPVQVIRETFKITCNDNNSKSYNYPNSGSTPTNVRVIATVQGEICGSNTTTSNDGRIAFVVDFSASMGRHKDVFVNSRNIIDGNDPLTNGTCGRYEAIRSIVDRIGNSNAQIALIPFASSTITNSNYYTNFISVNNFRSRYLNANTLCAYVPQDNGTSGVGAISTSVEEGTNYSAAFKSLKNMLGTSSAYSNQVFFITDGEPTAPSNTSTARSYAISEAQSLRNNVSNVTISAVLLRRSLSGSRLTEARETLETLTGSYSRVAEASNAADLANAINSVSQGSELNFDANSGTVTFRVNGYSETTLGLQSMERSGSTWRYVTQPFYLHGIPGNTINNQAIMKLTSRDGTQINQDLTVRYSMSHQ